MPANLPPQYYVAEQKYRAARGAAEKVAALHDESWDLLFQAC